MVDFINTMQEENKPKKRNKLSRLFFGLLFDEWSENGDKKTFKQNYLIDGILFVLGIILLIWFSLNNTFSLTKETLTTSWDELEPYLIQDLKIFKKTFPEDLDPSLVEIFIGLSDINKKIEYYTSISTVYLPKLDEKIEASTTPIFAKTYHLNDYSRSVYSNEFNAHVRFFNYKLTDFPYSKIGALKGYRPFKEIHLHSSIPIEVTPYES